MTTPQHTEHNQEVNWFWDIPPQANVQLGIESRISGKMFLESTEHHRTLLSSLNFLGCEMGSICVLLRLRCHLLLCGFLFFSLCSAPFLLGNEPREPATLFDESKKEPRHEKPNCPADLDVGVPPEASLPDRRGAVTGVRGAAVCRMRFPSLVGSIGTSDGFTSQMGPMVGPGRPVTWAFGEPKEIGISSSYMEDRCFLTEDK